MKKGSQPVSKDHLSTFKNRSNDSEESRLQFSPPNVLSRSSVSMIAWRTLAVQAT
jgi:hypothetical protein